MKLISSVFKDKEFMPSEFTCDGQNNNPPLEIADVPQNAKSLALICDDPDAPSGTWVHWVMWNINPNAKEIAENAVPAEATEGLNSAESKGYQGPCPPSGIHHYYFKLYALDIKLQLPESTSKAELLKAMEGHIIDNAQLMGLYGR